MSEHDEQTAVFEWAAMVANQHPELELLFAVPNGQYRPGQRMEPGLKRGVPDIMLPVPMYCVYAGQEYSGLALEMKFGKNKPTKEQEWWLKKLEQYGWQIGVCYSSIEAISAICHYLNIDYSVHG